MKKTLALLFLSLMLLNGCSHTPPQSLPENSSSPASFSDVQQLPPADAADLPGHFEGDDYSYRVLSTPEDLLAFAACVNFDETRSYLSYEWRLDADIDMTGYKWEPIGREVLNFYTPMPSGYDSKSEWEDLLDSQGFSGVFNGQGHTVSGIDCIGEDSEGVGFFGRLDRYASIRNLHVQGTFIGQSYVGGIAGTCSRYTNLYGGAALIEDCSFQGTIYAAGSCAGGIMGSTGASTCISRCFAEAEVYGSYDVGCLIGAANNNSSIIRSACRGTVHAISQAALREQLGDRQPPQAEDPYLSEGLPSHIGGLSGAAYNGSFSECVSDVRVVAEEPVNLIGNFVAYQSGKDTDCYYVGDYMNWGAGLAYAGSNSVITAKEITHMQLKDPAVFQNFDFGQYWKMRNDMPHPIRDTSAV